MIVKAPFTSCNRDIQCKYLLKNIRSMDFSLGSGTGESLMYSNIFRFLRVCKGNLPVCGLYVIHLVGCKQQDMYSDSRVIVQLFLEMSPQLPSLLSQEEATTCY